MGFFDQLFGKKAIEIAAPTAGTAVSLSQVPDPVFSEGLMGPGCAVIPTDGKICAPADGTVETLFATGHAFTISADSGAEILVHVGLDTVKLNGSAFTIIGKEGAKVKKGDVLIQADLEAIQAAGYQTITPVIVCNGDDFKEVTAVKEGTVSQGEVILTLKK